MSDVGVHSSWQIQRSAKTSVKKVWTSEIAVTHYLPSFVFHGVSFICISKWSFPKFYTYMIGIYCNILLMTIDYVQCGTVFCFFPYVFDLQGHPARWKLLKLIPSIPRLILCAVASNCVWWTWNRHGSCDIIYKVWWCSLEQWKTTRLLDGYIMQCTRRRVYFVGHFVKDHSLIWLSGIGCLLTSIYWVTTISKMILGLYHSYL